MSSTSPTPRPHAQRTSRERRTKQAQTAQRPTRQRASAIRKKAPARPTSATAVTSVAARSQSARTASERGPLSRVLEAVGGLLATFGRLIAKLASIRFVAIAFVVVLVLGVAGVVVANSPIFAATNIVVEGSEHVSAEAAERLISVPEGTTLLNVDTDAIAESLEENPWVDGVSVEREWPNTLRITPTERSMAAVVYIAADDIAWAVGSDGYWIAPISLSVTVDAEGNVVDTTMDADDATTADDAAGDDVAAGETSDDAAAADDATTADDTAVTDGTETTDDAGATATDDASAADATDAATDDASSTDDASDAADADGTADASTQQLTGTDAARAIASVAGALLFTDVPADIEPETGQEVTSDVVLAGLEYANGFSASFKEQIQSLSLASVDAITAYLTSGVEVALGEPEDIETKERVVTRLLEQEEGVTYINVRVPDSYSFRSAPAT